MKAKTKPKAKSAIKPKARVKSQTDKASSQTKAKSTVVKSRSVNQSVGASQSQVGSNQKIRIRLVGFDHRLVDKSALEIADRVKRAGSKIAGPIPLPTVINRYTVLRSPHVNKKSREQFEVRTHKRLLDILQSNPETVKELSKLDLSSGVDVDIKLS